MNNQEENTAYIKVYGVEGIDLIPGVEKSSDGTLRLNVGLLEGLNRKTRNLSMLMDSAKSIMAEKGLDNLLLLIMQSVT